MLTIYRNRLRLVLLIHRRHMAQQEHDVVRGTLNLMVLTAVSMLGPLHGYGLSRRIEQISGSQLHVIRGTFYPAVLVLEQMGWKTPKWGLAENSGRAKCFAVTRGGK